MVCKSCGKDINEEFEEYRNLRMEGYSHLDALEELEIDKQCCIMDVIAPGLITQPPTQKDHNEQRDRLDNLLEKELGFNAIMGSFASLSQVRTELSPALPPPGGADDAFDRLIGNIMNQDDVSGLLDSPDISDGPLLHLPEGESPKGPAKKESVVTNPPPKVTKRPKRRAIRRVKR